MVLYTICVVMCGTIRHLCVLVSGKRGLMHISHVTRFRKEQLVMDQTKIQDIVRHITKDEDYGVGMMEKLTLADAVEVMTQMLPTLKQRAKEKGSSNDLTYFNRIEKIYEKVMADKLRNAEHLWVVYCSTTAYPYMIDDDIMVLYNNKNASLIEKKLKLSGYEVSVGVENKEQFGMELCHMYRNGYKNIRLTDGDKNEYVIPREVFGTYEEFFRDDYVTNPGLQNAMIAYFQEFRKNTDKESIAQILDKRENNMLRVMVNSEYMVPCVKEETDAEVSIAHHFIDVTEQVTHKDGEQVIAIPALTDGFEMDKCYKGQYENMLYSYKELVEAIEELGASGAIFNPLGISYFIPLETLKKIEKDFC